MPLIQATADDIRSFMSNVDILPSGCWFWTGARSRGQGNLKWYSSFYVPSLRTTVRGHRFSSEVFRRQELPPGWHRSHSCCFSLCVCPECIEVLPREENQAAVRKRQRPEDFSLLLRRYGLESLLVDKEKTDAAGTGDR